MAHPRVTAALLAVAHAQERVLALGRPTAIERVPLAAAVGRWAAKDVIAQRTQPATDLSAMDGYAIRHADLPGPFTLVGESAAGRPWRGSVKAGEAVRIFTGAALPDGADCVLVQEEANREGEGIVLTGAGPGHPGRNVRRAGLDFGAGDLLIAGGERLTPARLALAAMAGHGMLAVRSPVRVAIAATGDELAPPGAPLAEGALPESNRLLLAAMLASLPVDIVDLGILPDDLAILSAAFAKVDADILVTTGGASVGDHDLVRPALERAGAKIDFWRIALRPGKPMMAGRMRETVVLGLPGNPVSAFVTAILFVLPLVRHLAGATHPFPDAVAIPLADALPANDGRADYLRARIIDGRASAAALQDSSMLRTLSAADCLIVREPNAPPATAGALAQVLLLA